MRSGSFGRPYRIEKGDGYLPVIVKPILPNHAEQEIVIVDLATKGPAQEPDGEKHLPSGELDWWVKCNQSIVDPRPRAMVSVRKSFDRVFESGGVFIIFADDKVKQELVLASSEKYSGLRIREQLQYTTWSFLSILDAVFVGPDHGNEIRIDSTSVLGKLLSDFSKCAVFQCKLGITNWASVHWQDLQFQTLAKNKYDEIVSAVVFDRNKLGLVIILPQIASKGAFLRRLLNEVVPELSPFFADCSMKSCQNCRHICSLISRKANGPGAMNMNSQRLSH